MNINEMITPEDKDNDIPTIEWEQGDEYDSFDHEIHYQACGTSEDGRKWVGTWIETDGAMADIDDIEPAEKDETNEMEKKQMPKSGTPEWHKLQIAKKTVKMNPAMAGVMGGPSIADAKKTLAEYGVRESIKSFEGFVNEERKFKIGDKYSSDFDYDGMLAACMKATTQWSIKKLESLYNSLEDVNYHTINRELFNTIKLIKSEGKDSEAAKKAMEIFHHAAGSEMNEGDDRELFSDDKEDGFFRLPNKVIGNDLYPTISRLRSFYSAVENGEDANIKMLDGIIKSLQDVRKAAVMFGKGEKIPDQYK